MTGTQTDHTSRKFYVKAETSKGQVVGYGVYDSVNGLESQHAVYAVNGERTAEVALHLANTHRDDLNAEIA